MSLQQTASVEVSGVFGVGDRFFCFFCWVGGGFRVFCLGLGVLFLGFRVYIVFLGCCCFFEVFVSVFSVYLWLRGVWVILVGFGIAGVRVQG